MFRYKKLSKQMDKMIEELNRLTPDYFVLLRRFHAMESANGTLKRELQRVKDKLEIIEGEKRLHG